uniref:Glutamine-dependent asparagine synthetase n=1 Tax=viral metagenome TaxID=1070528 RepID=A0A6C0E494_9ZZZZ
MGALQLIIYCNKTTSYNIEYTKSFMKMNRRGVDGTRYVFENMMLPTKITEDLMKRNMTRSEYRCYDPMSFVLGYHRQSINDLTEDGSQPFEDPINNQISNYPELRGRPKRKLMCNGEIYNYNELISNEVFTSKDLQSSCDVEVILPLYIRHGIEKTLELLDGDFSFILTENLNTFKKGHINIYAARDKLGAKPLYMVKGLKELFYMFSTELKGIPSHIINDQKKYQVMEVPPGSYWSFNNAVVNGSPNDFIKYHSWEIYQDLSLCKYTHPTSDVLPSIYKEIRDILTKSVKKMYFASDVKVGVLLSGGFDSSIILSVLTNILCVAPQNSQYNIVAFSIGDEDSDDVVNAKRCIYFLEDRFGISIEHHIVSVKLSLERYMEEIRNIIYDIETYDKRSVKEAIPMKILSEYIQKNTDVKVLLTGEGLDEMCGYTKLFEGSDEEFQINSVSFLQNLSKCDLMRAEKIASSCGLELRHPFLDIQFIDYMLKLHPRLKRPQKYTYNEGPIEKYILRKSFDLHDERGKCVYLAPENLWRGRKDASDSLKDIKMDFDGIYNDSDYYNYTLKCPLKAMPMSKEEMHYQILYSEHFPYNLN